MSGAAPHCSNRSAGIAAYSIFTTGTTFGTYFTVSQPESKMSIVERMDKEEAFAFGIIVGIVIMAVSSWVLLRSDKTQESKYSPTPCTTERSQ